MSIIQFPGKPKLPKTVTCVICVRDIAPADATMGLYDAEGRVAFACNGHYWDQAKFINGWADYAAAERQKWLQLRMTNIEAQRGGDSAWTLY